MWLTLRASTSSIASTAARSKNTQRCLATAVSAPSTPRAPPPIQRPPTVTRYEHKLANKAFAPNKHAQTPESLLETIGRNAPKYLGEKATTWEDLTKVYREGTPPLKEAGVSVKDRKYYVSWTRLEMACLTRYLRGESPVEFVRKPRPPKQFRRWGGKVQKGVRIFDQQGKRVHRTG